MTPRSTLEVAGIFRLYGERYRARRRLPLQQLRVMRAIETCRTATLGGHVEQCTHCSHQRIGYNSCRNRHCPKCQSTARVKWVRRRKAELLPVPYFHVVFTIPEQLNDLALQNKETLYKILFQASSQTLLTLAADPKHLGAHIGFFSILHTWGQNLLHHPHVHCVVTGGGVTPGRLAWKSCLPGFFLSVRVLSRLFRRLFLEALQQAFGKDQVQFRNRLSPLRAQFPHLLRDLARTEWVVYAKPPFGGPAQAIEYLGRYTHRVALSNERLTALQGGQVTFQYKDYRSRDRQKSRQLTLDAEEFIRRFLLHTLPLRFSRIRHYGLLASRNKQTLLKLCRRLLGQDETLPLPTAGEIDRYASRIPATSWLCPLCGVGQMVRTGLISARLFFQPIQVIAVNSS